MLTERFDSRLDGKGGFRMEGKRFYKEKLTEAAKLFDASNIDWSSGSRIA